MSYSYMYYQQEYDPDDDVLAQPRCKDCKAFLTSKETETLESKYPEWVVSSYDADGNEVYEQSGYYVEYTPVWKCKRCGTLNMINDAYPRW